jgi:molybdopterin-guanine dinucleotide biosynthesis protein A
MAGTGGDKSVVAQNCKANQPGVQSLKPGTPARPKVEVCILAGGLSTRMGRDKARLRLDGRTLLAWVRAAARATGWPVRVVRRDRVPRCGPLGGVWTAFQRSRADRLVFLSCDMPFVSAELIRTVAERVGKAVFVWTEEGAGFPFALDRECVSLVERMLARRRFALHSLAQEVRARRLRVRARQAGELLNVNTVEDFRAAQRTGVDGRRQVHSGGEVRKRDCACPAPGAT